VPSRNRRLAPDRAAVFDAGFARAVEAVAT
jgi:hypothetical protein